jgi:hypothetical protein
MIIDGTKRAVEQADTADLAELLTEQTQTVERESSLLTREICTLLAVQKELARRGFPLGLTLSESLGFVTVIRTGLNKELLKLANNENVPEQPTDHSAN